MARFYDKEGNPKNVVPKASGKGTRSTRITDAKKHDWYVSISTICGALGPFDGLTYWFKSEPLKYAAGKQAWELLRDDNEKWLKETLAKAEKEMGKAADLGLLVHENVELYHKWRALGKTMQIEPFPHRAKPYIRAIDAFCDEHEIIADPELLEKAVVLKDARTAGTLDFGGKGFDKDLIVLDWKTQKVKNDNPRMWFKYRLQVCAYANAVCEIKGVQPDYAGIIILDTSKAKEYSRENLPEIYYELYDKETQRRYYNYFLMLASLYYASQDWL